MGRAGAALRTTRAWTELEPLREARWTREALPIELLRNGLQEPQRQWSHTDDGTWPAAEREAWFALMQRLALKPNAGARRGAAAAADGRRTRGRRRRQRRRANRETGSWGSAAEYAATHAALVREDFVRPLRAALRQVRAGEPPPRECRMWAGVTIGAAAVGEPGGLLHRLQLTDEQHAELEGGGRSLLNGALLLVSADGFRRVRPAVIARREASRQLGDGTLFVSFHDDNLVDPRGGGEVDASPPSSPRPWPRVSWRPANGAFTRSAVLRAVMRAPPSAIPQLCGLRLRIAGRRRPVDVSPSARRCRGRPVAAPMPWRHRRGLRGWRRRR